MRTAAWRSPLHGDRPLAGCPVVHAADDIHNRPQPVCQPTPVKLRYCRELSLTIVIVRVSLTDIASAGPLAPMGAQRWR